MSREAKIKSLRRDLAGDTVRRFIERGIARLPAPEPASAPLSVKALHAHIVHKFERLRAQQRESARQAEHLFQALLQRAFQGEV